MARTNSKAPDAPDAAAQAPDLDAMRVRELAAYERDLNLELARVRNAIALRAGEVDPDGDHESPLTSSTSSTPSE